MDLTSVKYQDSCIYIGLESSQERGSEENSLETIKSAYAVYKIKAHGNYVRDTILIRKKDITVIRGEIIVKFELNQLHRPEECEIEILSLKVIYFGGKIEELEVNKSYSFLEIRSIPLIVVNKNNSFKKNNRKVSKNIAPNRISKRVLSIKEEIIVLPPEPKIRLESEVVEIPLKKEEKIVQDEITVIEPSTPPSIAVSEVESKIERKLDAQTKKLERDLNQLCYETIDALLTALPQPEFAEDYRASNPMVKSIHKYITVDLLQKELEEGESA